MQRDDLTPDRVDAKVALDRSYRPIGTIETLDEEEGRVMRVRISPHREFRKKHPDLADEIVLDASSIAKLWGHNVVLDKDIAELL